jgi:hypothetical protein
MTVSSQEAIASRPVVSVVSGAKSFRFIIGFVPGLLSIAGH